MQKFRLKSLFSLSFSHKVLLYAAAVSCISLFIMGLSFISYDVKETRRGLVSTLELQADMIANHSAEAIAAQNKDKTNEVLNTIGSNRYVKGAWVYDNNGVLFSSYDPNQIGSESLPKPFQHAGVFFDKNTLTVARPIIVGANVLGTVLVQCNLDRVHSRALFQAMIVLCAMLFALCSTLLISIRFQRSLTRPLESLTKTAKKVAVSKDYSIRAERMSHDDLGMLTDAFNRMLFEVEQSSHALKLSEERLYLALWGSNDVLFDWDMELDQFYFDQTLENVLGIKESDAPKTIESFLNLIHADDLAAVQDALSAHLKGSIQHFEMEYRLRTTSLEFRWILTRGKVVSRDAQSKPLRFTGTFGDVTERKAIEGKLKLFHQVFSSTTEGVVVTDPQLRFFQSNQAFSDITGYSLDELEGKPLETLYDNEQSANLFNHIRKSIENDGNWQGEIVFMRKNQQSFPVHFSLNAMFNEHKKIVHYVGVFADLTISKEKENQLQFLTDYDVLTGLPNRDLFNKNLKKHMLFAKESNECLGLIIVGFDHFKELNDSCGHELGDNLLKAVASRLLELVHSTNRLARVGGDEFAVIIEHIESPNELKIFAEKVAAIFSSKYVLDNHEIVTTGCLGISIYPNDAQDASALIIHADTAMLHAKKEGRNTYHFFIPSMNEEVIEKNKLESMLRFAIERQEFRLYFQPKVDIRNNCVLGAEALLRWDQPEVGMISPARFIPVVEEMGLIVEIGDWVLRQALVQGVRWALEGLTDCQIAVNVSGLQFKKIDFIEKIEKCLHDTGFLAKNLDIEITEGALMTDANQAIHFLNTLKALGISISIDDFGTGYSSLSYLSKFPIDCLKIDQSFIAGMLESSENENIIRAVIAMAKGLKLKTVAEGVECYEQVLRLQELGCDVIQGYYFSKPLLPEAFLAYTKTFIPLKKTS